MLICPRCQFENPDPNNFCQACGTSLTEKPCPNCGSIVQWSDDRCFNCGTFTGTIRAAIVEGNLETINHDRYQRFESDSEQLRVLDRNPLKQSPLEVVPNCAKPYLTLQLYFHQVIPLIYAAWQQADAEVLILEDRSTFPQLIDVLRNSKPLPLLQLLHWLYEMTDLWEALEPLQQRQSLLEIGNLRLDEDELLCLQRLYSDPTPTLGLKNLGTLWQTLLTQSKQPPSAELTELIAAIHADQITTIEDLRSRLKAIAEQATPDSESKIDLFDEIMSDPRSFDSLSTPLSNLDVPPEEAITLIPEPAPDGDSDDMPTVVLPMQLFSLDDAGKTDIGRQRNHNEDCFGIDTHISKVQLPTRKRLSARGVYVLCDGMGGHASGEVASQLAVDTLRNYFKQHWQDTSEALPSLETIRAGVQLANKAIYSVNQDGARSGSGRMGTTLVMLLIQNTEAAVAHVGDSRLYSYTRKQGLKQITVDHEVGQREILRGVEPEIAYGRPDAYQLTQALGPRDEYFVNPDVQFFELVEDTLLLLASDGLTDNDLLETHWQTHLDPLMSSQTNLDQGVTNLIELANQYNGHDNITAIAVRAKIRPNLESTF